MIWPLCSLLSRDSRTRNWLRTTHHLLGYLHHEEQWAPSLYCKRSNAQFNCYLVHLFQDHGFFQSRPATGHSHATSVQHDLATPSSVLLVPPTLSSCLDANRGINLLVIDLSDYLSLRLPRTNQTWKGESTGFQVKKGY